ncbi:MAG: FAD-dependent oxidoreductase [Planctomycetota bacterium]
MKRFDVIVLGGGSAGTSAARAATEAGARTLMINEGELGGLCILRGCMPTKTMLHAAHAAHEAIHGRVPGVKPRGADIDFGEIMRNKDQKVARFQRAKLQSIEKGGYEVLDARGRFTGPDTIEANGEAYHFERGAVISTGSVTRLPDLDGLDAVPYLTSDEIMRLEEQPASLIILGTGAIGLEMSQFFARVGTRVCLVSRRPVFSDVDPAVAEEMEAVLNDEPNLELYQPKQATRVRKSPEGIALDLEDGTCLKAEHLVLATGRQPALNGLGLEKAGIEVKGHEIQVGADQRTSNPKVFIAGDASGNRMILHVANWEGKVAGRNAADPGSRETVDHRLDVMGIFTDPPLATVGLNERAAKEAGLDPIVAEVHFANTGRAITQEVSHGAGKLVAARATGEILGAQLLAPRADDLVHIVSAIMFYRGTAAQMLEMPWYHPTLAEVLLSLARDLAAQVRG